MPHRIFSSIISSHLTGGITSTGAWNPLLLHQSLPKPPVPNLALLTCAQTLLLIISSELLSIFHRITSWKRPGHLVSTKHFCYHRIHISSLQHTHSAAPSWDSADAEGCWQWEALSISVCHLQLPCGKELPSWWQQQLTGAVLRSSSCNLPSACESHCLVLTIRWTSSILTHPF